MINVGVVVMFVAFTTGIYMYDFMHLSPLITIIFSAYDKMINHNFSDLAIANYDDNVSLRYDFILLICPLIWHVVIFKFTYYVSSKVHLLVHGIMTL